MTYDPAIPTLGHIYSQQNHNSKKIHAPPRYIAAVFTIAWTWKLSRHPSTEEWIKKIRSVQTVEYYSAKKKNEILPFVVTWMALEGINLSEINQTKKILYDFTFMWGLKSKTNEETNKT